MKRLLGRADNHRGHAGSLWHGQDFGCIGAKHTRFLLLDYSFTPSGSLQPAIRLYYGAVVLLAKSFTLPASLDLGIGLAIDACRPAERRRWIVSLSALISCEITT